MVDRFRSWEMELICRLNVRRNFEHGHQLREIIELCKARSCPVTRALRRKLNGGRRFAKGRCPAVKVCQPFLLEEVMLQIPHHGKQLRHGVGNRCAGGKHNTLAVCDLVDVAAL